MPSYRRRPGRLPHLFGYRDRAGREHTQAFRLKRDGQRWAEEQEAAVRRGTHVDPRAGEVLVRDYAEHWRAVQREHRPRTRRLVESVFRVHLYPALGARRMDSVLKSDVEGLVDGWAGRPATTVRGRFAFIRAMFNDAVGDGIIVKSPCAGVKLPSVRRQETTMLAVADVEAIMAALPEPYATAILLGATCGPRISEVLGLTVDRVGFLTRSVRFDHQLSESAPWTLEPTKSRPRTVPAPAITLEALSRLESGEQGLLFTRPDGSPISARSLAGRFAKAVRSTQAPISHATAMAETAPPTFHTLRHSFATLLIERGASVTTVADRLGDTIEVTLRDYAHLVPDAVEQTRGIVETAWQSHADQARTNSHSRR